METCQGSSHEGEHAVKGFSDLHKGYFQSRLRAFKRKVFSCFWRGVNMVIPDTAAQVMSDRVGSYLKRLKKHKYTVVMTAVHASRETCNRNGKRREVEEGAIELSWPYAMKSIDSTLTCAVRWVGTRSASLLSTTRIGLKNKVMMIEPRQGVQLELISNNHDYGYFSGQGACERKCVRARSARMRIVSLAHGISLEYQTSTLKHRYHSAEEGVDCESPSHWRASRRGVVIVRNMSELIGFLFGVSNDEKEHGGVEEEAVSKKKNEGEELELHVLYFC